ncbi:metallophosphoesterase family protein [Kribbella solani]|uniref:metallophosphoesterase family protein n=1 Tax=Kribbella solani TaxID=236067 RepID=UPI0029A2450D|nr:metallophosphoesterase family protein [Kribbella solani]MDX2971200.1 metallophosphoesterase family protein [Kribbella solani]MDX3006986.1 metallophosphoesterase family protein [Kribbella solani]
MTRVYAVSDIHGHLDKLTTALHAAGLTDADGNWAGADARLWFLGDFFDRGPDGIGVLRYVRGLIAQAPAGAIRMLLGNHEILALGMHKFGDTFVPHDGLTLRSFERSWALNGGLDRDQELLTDDEVAWLLDQPLLALDAGNLLMHSDTSEYVEWGDTRDQINAAAHAQLHSDDIEMWWEIWRRMTSRYAFRGPSGPEVARIMLQHLGGHRIVHGHSIVADQLGIDAQFLTGPHLYADGLALGIDGGAFDGGPCLVVELEELTEALPSNS